MRTGTTKFVFVLTATLFVVSTRVELTRALQSPCESETDAFYDCDDTLIYNKISIADATTVGATYAGDGSTYYYYHDAAAFSLYNISSTSFRYGSHGWVSFSATNQGFSSSGDIPQSGMPLSICAFFAELDCQAPNGVRVFEVEKAGVNHVRVVDVDCVTKETGSPSIKFQVQLFFSDFHIEIHYETVEIPLGNTAGVAIGINEGGANGSSLTYKSQLGRLQNAAGMPASFRAIGFYPPGTKPASTVDKTTRTTAVISTAVATKIGSSSYSTGLQQSSTAVEMPTIIETTGVIATIATSMQSTGNSAASMSSTIAMTKAAEGAQPASSSDAALSMLLPGVVLAVCFATCCCMVAAGLVVRKKMATCRKEADSTELGSVELQKCIGVDGNAIVKTVQATRPSSAVKAEPRPVSSTAITSSSDSETYVYATLDDLGTEDSAVCYADVSQFTLGQNSSESRHSQ